MTTVQQDTPNDWADMTETEAEELQLCVRGHGGEVLKARLNTWIDEQLQQSNQKEIELLSEQDKHGTELNYWLGRRDLLWALQRWIGKQS